MIASAPGDPLWIRGGVFIIKDISDNLPVGMYLSSPHRAIFLDREIILDRSYVKAYVENIGERLIHEEDVQEFLGDKNAR